MAARVASTIHRRQRERVANHRSQCLTSTSSSLLESMPADEDVGEIFIQSNEILRLQQPEAPTMTTSTASNFDPKSCSTPKRNSNRNNNSLDDIEASSSNCSSPNSSTDSELPSDSPIISAFQSQSLVPNNNVPVQQVPQFRAPILGYEVIEQNDKFTAFKIKVERICSGETWFVFRRYTDFIRLHHKLTGLFPHLKFQLPPKRWFKDNFDPTFLEQRILGLQCFVNSLLENNVISQNTHVADFFCLNDPPCPNDNLQASRLRCECMETIISNLSLELKEKQMENEVLKAELALAKAQKETLLKSLRIECSLVTFDDHPTFQHLHQINVLVLEKMENCKLPSDVVGIKLIRDCVSDASIQQILTVSTNDVVQSAATQRPAELAGSPSPTGSEVYKANSSALKTTVSGSTCETPIDSNGNPTYLELHQIKPD